MNITSLAAAAVVLIAASGALATVQAGEKLSAGEIVALFPGQYEAIWKDKHKIEVVADRDGDISGSFGVMSGNGRWSVVGDQLCVSSWWFSKDRCSEVVRQGDWYFGMHNGKGKPRVRFRPQ
jgi:hypothetical protein